MEKYIPENELDQVSGGAMVERENIKTGYCPNCKALKRFTYTDDGQAQCRDCGNAYTQNYIDSLYEAYKNGTLDEASIKDPTLV